MTTTIERNSSPIMIPARLANTWDGQRVRFASQSEAELVRLVRRRAADMASASDAELRHLCLTLRESIARRQRPLTPQENQAKRVAGASLICESVRRTRGWKLHSEQILAGLLLANRNVVELVDGEGKTLAAAIPALIGWMDGFPVHIATANEALALRDYRHVGPVFERLGQRVSLLPHDTDRSRFDIYQADVVYGSCQDFVIDDRQLRELSQHNIPHGMLVLDDLDAVLIDQAEGGCSDAVKTNRSGDMLPEMRQADHLVWRRDSAHEFASRADGVVTGMSWPRFFQQYQSMCGLAGATIGTDEEFNVLYGLKTIVIPRRRKCRRVELRDRYFATNDDKLSAVLDEITNRHRNGQPVFVGAVSSRELRRLSECLRRMRVQHQTLTGEHPSREMRLVADAGRFGTVTLATPQAGFGTTIMLDERSLQVGGLYVIGMERQATRRLDRRLANLAGQNGQFGFCRFFVSGEDELLRKYAPKLARRIQESAGPDGEVHDQCDFLIQQLQHALEQMNFMRRREHCRQASWPESILADLKTK